MHGAPPCHASACQGGGPLSNAACVAALFATSMPPWGLLSACSGRQHLSAPNRRLPHAWRRVARLLPARRLAAGERALARAGARAPACSRSGEQQLSRRHSKRGFLPIIVCGRHGAQQLRMQHSASQPEARAWRWRPVLRQHDRHALRHRLPHLRVRGCFLQLLGPLGAHPRRPWAAHHLGLLLCVRTPSARRGLTDASALTRCCSGVLRAPNAVLRCMPCSSVEDGLGGSFRRLRVAGWPSFCRFAAGSCPACGPRCSPHRADRQGHTAAGLAQHAQAAPGSSRTNTKCTYASKPMTRASTAALHLAAGERELEQCLDSRHCAKTLTRAYAV